MLHHHQRYFDQRLCSRRQMLKQSSLGFGFLALAGLTNESTGKEIFQGPLAAKTPHFPARAKRVIMMFMQGGPSHVDTFDYKPELQASEGKSYGRGNLLASPWQFSPQGESGLPISELFPHLSQHADDLCLINSMHTDNPAHPQATIMMHTGSINFVRPSMGSWAVYGLGTANKNLPGFVTINPVGNLGGAQNYGSAFLPAAYQGTRVDTGKDPIANIQSRRPRKEQREHLDLLQALNEDALRTANVDTELEGVIESYELAFRMQSEVPNLLDLSEETNATKEAYGLNSRETANFGTQCLMARRFAEAGVRFIEITHRGWDQHNALRTKLPSNCQAIDQPISALLQDLKQRNLLEDTLVIWTGEFGRTATDQNNGNGRRHNNRGFTTWLAGGGVKGGIRHGATDPVGMESVENKVHIHDLHATVLHLLGLNHEELTYRHSGRDFRLTDVYGNVVNDILA